MTSVISDNRVILDISLNDGNINTNHVPDEMKAKGGRYLTSRYIQEETDPNIHPISSANNIYISPGFLSGTSCSSSGRTSIGAKSPLTNGIKESNVGGNLGTYLARHGIAAIKIRGNTNKANSDNSRLLMEKTG